MMMMMRIEMIVMVIVMVIVVMMVVKEIRKEKMEMMIVIIGLGIKKEKKIRRFSMRVIKKELKKRGIECEILKRLKNIG